MGAPASAHKETCAHLTQWLAQPWTEQERRALADYIRLVVQRSELRDADEWWAILGELGIWSDNTMPGAQMRAPGPPRAAARFVRGAHLRVDLDTIAERLYQGEARMLYGWTLFDLQPIVYRDWERAYAAIPHEHWRRCLHYRLWDGHTQPQTAELMFCDIRSVHNWERAALNHMLASMQGWRRGTFLFVDGPEPAALGVVLSPSTAPATRSGHAKGPER